MQNTISSNSGPWHAQLYMRVLIAMILGVLLAYLFGAGAERAVGWMGTIFVRLLRMIIVPLIFTSIVTGVASVGSGRALGRLGGKTLAYYIGSSFLAILTGLILVNVIRPGVGAQLVSGDGGFTPPTPPDSLAEIFIRMVPTNPIAAMAEGDMLGIIFFAIVLGIALAHLREEVSKPLSSLFEQIFELMMVLTGGIMKLLPLGVLGLITRAAVGAGLDGPGSLGAMAEVLRPLAMYMLTIAMGLLIHLFVALPLLLMLIGRMSPRVHYRNMREAMMTAFSTSSSAATLPVTMECVEHKVGVSNRVMSFVLPMGATVNMDGTALYECVAVIFIAQVLGVDLSVAQQWVIVMTALLASIGAAGVPSAGLVMIFIVTDAVQLTGPEVATIVGTLLAIDRPLDMMRTAVNVTSDSVGAALIARSEGEPSVNQS